MNKYDYIATALALLSFSQQIYFCAVLSQTQAESDIKYLKHLGAGLWSAESPAQIYS